MRNDVAPETTRIEVGRKVQREIIAFSMLLLCVIGVAISYQNLAARLEASLQAPQRAEPERHEAMAIQAAEQDPNGCKECAPAPSGDKARQTNSQSNPARTRIEMRTSSAVRREGRRETIGLADEQNTPSSIGVSSLPQTVSRLPRAAHDRARPTTGPPESTCRADSARL